MKTGDWLIVILCLLLIPLSWSLTHRQQSETDAIEITVGNQSPVSYSIKGNRHINVTGDIGDSVIEIKDGRVRITESPCNSKVCILSGWHQHSGSHISCLPNKVDVSLLSQQDRFDGINF